MLLREPNRTRKNRDAREAALKRMKTTLAGTARRLFRTRVPFTLGLAAAGLAKVRRVGLSQLGKLGHSSGLAFVPSPGKKPIGPSFCRSQGLGAFPPPRILLT